MKKHILILLFLTSFLQAQTYPVNPTKFGKISLNTNSVSTSTTKINTQESDGQINYIDAVNLPIPTSVLNVIKQKADLSTGLIKNGLISINADPTKFNVSAGIGIISNFDDPENPVSTVINFPAFTGITPTYLTTGNITYIAVNSTPAIVMQATPFTPIQRRDLIVLGAVIHSNLTNINVVNNISAPSNAIGNQLHDFIEAVGALNITGNKYSANGANLSLNKSAGSIFKFGVNFATDWKNPHQISQSSGTALTFRYRTQNGTEGSDVTVLNPAVYDLANVLTAVPNNKFTIQTVTMFQTGLTRIQYGQNYYDDLASAQAAIFTRDFNVEANIKENGVTRAYIIVKNNATSLQNATDSRIIEAQKFGGVASGGVALTFANIVSALGYTPANDVGVVHKTGDTFSFTSTTFNPLLSYNSTSTNIEKRILEPQTTNLPTSYTYVLGWGDSLTQGAGGFGTTYETTITGITGFTVVNNGVGGETSTQIKTRFLADTGNLDKSVIIWAGRNNYLDPTTVKADIAAMVAALSHTRYLVVGIINGNYPSEYINQSGWTTIQQLNADLKAIYGKRFVDIRPYLVSLHDNSAQDLIDFANDIPPNSLRADNIHLTGTGYTRVGEYLNQRLGILFGYEGYLQGKDVNGLLNQLQVMHTIGNETFTGIKTVTNTTNTQTNGLLFNNSGNTTAGWALGFINTAGGNGIYGSNTAGGTGLYIDNTGATGTGIRVITSGTANTAFRADISGSSRGFVFTNNGTSRTTDTALSSNTTGHYVSSTSGGSVSFWSTGIGTHYAITNGGAQFGILGENQSTGVFASINSATASTADLFQLKKNNVLTTKIDHNGILTTPSPVFIGTPTAPTATAGTNTTQIATTAFVQNAYSSALLTTGNQSFTGAKSSINTGTFGVVNGLELENSGTADSRVINLLNSNTGIGMYLINSASGIGSYDINNSSGVLKIFESSTGSTGDLTRWTKNLVTKAKVDQNGEFTAQKYNLNTGINSSAGNAVLVGGTISITTTAATANSIVMLTRKTSGGTIGNLTYTTSAGGISINSDSVSDTSTVSYLIIN